MTNDPRLTNVDLERVEELQVLQLEVDRAEDALAWADDRLLAYVAVLRREGSMTWDEIGAVLGVSRQAAHARFAARVHAFERDRFGLPLRSRRT